LHYVAATTLNPILEGGRASWSHVSR